MSSIMDEKITNDPIHGIIKLHPILIKIIDTPQFQRLRNIKQLGGCYFVYPGASHNRFEHSIGVCYLAGKLARHLQAKIKEDGRLKDIEMTDDDVLCIEIAGLCHDIGHGPYSHLFDLLFKEAMIKKDRSVKPWKHEEVSQNMIKHMIERNDGLRAELDTKFGEKERENKVKFILNLIVGKSKDDKPQRRFMYQIVSNSKSGIDVDKMDYFARDCHGLGIKNSFDHNRYISMCRVMFKDGMKTTIAVRDKEILNLYELFHTRIGLFRRAYYHKVTKAVEIMLTEALVEANDVYDIKGRDHSSSKKRKLSNAFEDMYAYEQLTDCVFENILHEDKEEFKASKKLISRIYARDLYKMVYESAPNEEISSDELTKKITDISKLTDKDFVVEEFKFNYGKKEKNPISKVYFYKKENTDCYPGSDIKPEEVSLFLPSGIFQEKIVRVYAKKDEIIDALKEAIKEAKLAIQETQRDQK